MALPAQTIGAGPPTTRSITTNTAEGERHQQQGRDRRRIQAIGAELLIDQQRQGRGVGCAEEGDGAEIAEGERGHQRARQTDGPAQQRPVDQPPAAPACDAEARRQPVMALDAASAAAGATTRRTKGNPMNPLIRATRPSPRSSGAPSRSSSTKRPAPSASGEKASGKEPMKETRPREQKPASSEDQHQGAGYGQHRSRPWRRRCR